MVKSSYRYVLELLRGDGSSAGRAVAHVDWDAAEESARFAALRCGGPVRSAWRDDSSAEPIWHPTLGTPFVSGLRVTVRGEGGDSVSTDVSTAYFGGCAQDAVSQLVARGTLASGERVVFLTTAFLSDEPPRLQAPAVFDAVDAAPHLPLPGASMADVERDAVLTGAAEADDVPVFVPQTVLDEAARLAREAGSSETGGVLVGNVHRDSGGTDLFVRVSAQLAARHTEASATRLTFTSETWTDMRAALALRRREEVMVGWWHSHPVRHWCKDCPVERQRVCGLVRNFFSDHDRALHRAVFSAAYCVALVVNDGAGEPTFSLFGWRRGLIELRAFGVTGASGRAEAGASQRVQTECDPCSQREPTFPTSVPSPIG